MIKTYKILIVDDESSIVETFKEKLLLEKFDVISASDGKEGLEKALKEHPDLILLDLLMPLIDGLSMLKELRKDNWGKDVAVIILTNLDDNKKVAEIVKEGTYDYLIKTDWEINDIVEKIKQKLDIV